MHKNKSVKPPVPHRAPTTIIVAEPPSTNAESNKRYFVNDDQKPMYNQKSNRSSTEKLISESSNSQTSGSGDVSVDSCEPNDEPKPFSQRKKLGQLPSFIPID